MELESSLIAAQNALIVNPSLRDPQQQADAREQQLQKRNTELPLSQVVVRQNKPEAFAQAERFRQQQQTFNDNPNNRSRTAINTYQSLAKEQQRQDLQRLLGVDTYV